MAQQRATAVSVKRFRRLIRQASVTITTATSGLSYAEVMAKTTRTIELKNLDITVIRPGRTMMGVLILRIPGPESKAQAATLVNCVTEVLEKTEVYIATP